VLKMHGVHRFRFRSYVRVSHAARSETRTATRSLTSSARRAIERSLIARPSLRLQCRCIRCTFSPAASARDRRCVVCSRPPVVVGRGAAGRTMQGVGYALTKRRRGESPPPPRLENVLLSFSRDPAPVPPRGRFPAPLACSPRAFRWPI